MSKQPFDSNWKFIKHVDVVSEFALNGDTFGPRFIEINLANSCNLACDWCFCKHYNRDGTKLDIAYFKKFCDEFIELGGRAITFAGGGEPTIHPDFLKFVEIGKESGLEMALITNGTFKPEYAKTVASDLEWVRFSVDTVDRTEFKNWKGVDLVDRTLSNIEKVFSLPSRRARVGVCCNLDSDRSWTSVHELLQSCIPIADYVQFRPVLPQTRNGEKMRFSETLWKVLREEQTKNPKIILSLDKVEDILNHASLTPPCVGHVINPILDADGTLRICMYHPHNSNFELGNIYESSLKEIWESKKRQDVVQWLYKQKDLYALGCQPGCKLTELNKFLNFVTDGTIRDVNFL